MSGFLLEQYRNRTFDHNMSLFGSDCSTDANLSATDRVGFHVYRQGAATSAINVTSSTVSAAGSTVTFTPGTNDIVVKIAQSDTSALETGAYEAEIIVLLDGDNVAGNTARAMRVVDKGVFFLHPESLAAMDTAI